MDSATLERWLAEFVEKSGGVAGTVHLVAADGVLELAASLRIPEPVQRAVARVPSGKGMAGLALERRQPVQTCNLQTDSSGQVRPGARAVDAQAAVALPVMGGDAVRAVVGVAFLGERELDAAELERLSNEAATLP